MLFNEYNTKLIQRTEKENMTSDYLSRSPEITEIWKVAAIEESKNNDLEVLRKIHEDLIHPRGTRLYKTLKGKTDAKGLKAKCELLAKKCIRYQQDKNFRKEFYSSGSIHSSRRNKDLAADILGPIELSYFLEGGGKRYVLVIMDRHSRFCMLK